MGYLSPRAKNEIINTQNMFVCLSDEGGFVYFLQSCSLKAVILQNIISMWLADMSMIKGVSFYEGLGTVLVTTKVSRKKKNRNMISLQDHQTVFEKLTILHQFVSS